MTELNSCDPILQRAAEDSMSDHALVRDRVRSLTLLALRERQFDADGFNEVMHAIVAGVSVGADKHPKHIKEVLSGAFRGVDEAFTRAAHASSLAVKELSARGRDFSLSELTQALEQVRRLEADFLETWRKVANSASEAVRTEMLELVCQAERAGTNTGRVVKSTLREFSLHMGATLRIAQKASLDSARSLSQRFAQAASGFLIAMSEAIRREDLRRSK